MPRQARTLSASGFYHVIQRGNGKQIIFEDNSDYTFFLKLLAQNKLELGFQLHAFCLMENHFHLLIRTEQSLGKLMQKLSSEYAAYFNKKYGRIGHLFQDRFKSETIEDREYYFTVIRYILYNPVKAHVSSLENYRWSSYWEYLNGSKITDTQMLLKMIGGPQAFLAFVQDYKPTVKCLDDDIYYSINDAMAQEIIKNKLGIDNGSKISFYNKASRDESVLELYKNGLSMRQIERLMGISRSVISRIVNKYN